MLSKSPNAEAGARFKEVVEIALARSRRVHNMTQLKKCTGLHGNTLYDIFNGDLQDGPHPRTVNAVASCLDIPTRHLWDAWQGREPEPDSAEEALRRHADAVDRQTRVLDELVGFIRSAAEAVASPLDDPTEETEAQQRAAKAEPDPEQPGSGESSTRPAPPETAGSGQ